MERALDAELDIVGDFFENEEDEDENMKNIVKGDKITPLFKF